MLCLHLRPRSAVLRPLAIIKQCSCLFILSSKPHSISTAAESSRAQTSVVSKLLVTSLFLFFFFLFFYLQILHAIDFASASSSELPGSISDYVWHAQMYSLITLWFIQSTFKKWNMGKQPCAPSDLQFLNRSGCTFVEVFPHGMFFWGHKTL